MNQYRIPNLDKACAVMSLVADTPGGLKLKEFSHILEIPRTTALRIAQTLLRAGFLDETEEGRYTLGTTLVQIGVKALDNLDIRGFARPVLRALAEETGESCHLAVLNGDKSMLVEVADSPRPVRIAARPGTLVDLHCSSTGKVFLAFSVDEPARFCASLDLSPHTANTDTTVQQVLKSIAETRKQGYALDNEEYVAGVRCIAAPVVNAFGKTVAAIGATASTATLTKAKVPRMAERVVRAAREVTAQLGHAK